MKKDKGQEVKENDLERETGLMNTIAGDSPGEYFVLANWNDMPVEPGEIHGCLVSVQSSANEIQWQTMHSLDTWIFVLKRLTPDSLLIGTSGGDLIRITRGQVETIKTGLEVGIGDIWVINERDCWLAHEEGLAHWDGQRLSKNRASATIHKIHALAPNFAVAVGEDGLVLLFDGKKWREVDSSPTNKHLIGVFCVARDQIFVCGWRGAIYMWDGKDHWQKIKFIGDVDASEIYASSPVEYLGDVYVCAGGRGLYKIHGKIAEKVQDCYADDATVIDDKLIVTGGSSFNEFDGTDWVQAEIVLPD